MQDVFRNYQQHVTWKQCISAILGPQMMFFLILSWRQMLLWALAFNNGLFVGYDIFILGRVQNFPSKPSLHRRRKWSRRHLRREKGQVSLGGTRNKFLTLVNMLPAICIGATFITEWVLVSAESESEFIARDQAGISTVQENGWRRPHQPRARRYRWRQTYNQDGFTAPAWQGIWRDLPQLWRALLLLGSQVRFFDVTPVTHKKEQHARFTAQLVADPRTFLQQNLTLQSMP